MRVCVDTPASSSLADGGANVCATNDPTLLVDVIKIDPIPSGTVVGNKSMSSFCTHKGFLPMPLLDSSIHYQPFLVCLDATDTILSLEHIINNNHKLARWCQEGSKAGLKNSCPHPGCLSFYGHYSNLLLLLPLTKNQGLYYCSKTIFIPGSSYHSPATHRVSTTVEPQHDTKHYPVKMPTSCRKQLLLEL
jgi:hypothetical protein